MSQAIAIQLWIAIAHLTDRREDVYVSTAPADVAAHLFANVIVSFGVSFCQQCDRRHNLTWSAVAALKTIVVDEGSLHGMQFFTIS